MTCKSFFKKRGRPKGREKEEKEENILIVRMDLFGKALHLLDYFLTRNISIGDLTNAGVSGYSMTRMIIELIMRSPV